MAQTVPELTRQASDALIDWRAARDIGLRLARPVAGVEALALSAVTGRVTAESATSPIPLPPFDNSAMDGFALATADLGGLGPLRLAVAGRVAAGEAAGPLPPGTCLRILTGAPIPPGADAVVMQEHVTRHHGSITLTAAPRPGANIRRAGEDLAKGGEVLPPGRLIGAREAGVLAATGHARVSVRQRVRVALICSGSELRAPGAPLAPGQIWDANRYLLAAALTAPWIELLAPVTVPDEPDAIATALLQAAGGADLMISTGGMADGDEDHIPRLLRALGGEIHALRVAIKPGKPVALGRLGDAVHVGLPGNPVAAFVTWACLGAPILRRLGGFADPLPALGTVRLAKALSRRPGRAEFRPARLRPAGLDGLPVAELLTPTFSARIALLASADGLALIPAEIETLPAGAALEFLAF
ncbi:MAG: molybdopterin molybdotransferase MoeA [Alkalilacustris sp.]